MADKKKVSPKRAKRVRLGAPAVVKVIERNIPAEQLRAPAGTFTDDPSEDADGKSEVVVHRKRVSVKTYWMVNPAGTVHMLPREQAIGRLRQSKGWRMATKAEIAEYKARKGHQVFDDPIAPRWAEEVAADADFAIEDQAPAE